jgi:6-phosphogluconolactonase (cycloisomerase 2 family)
LTANGSTTATGLKPTSITIRSDDTWMFVTNYNSASVSQYAITPATGLLTAQQAISTDNYPWGVAVK